MKCFINGIVVRKSNIANRSKNIILLSFAMCVLRCAIAWACPFCSDNVTTGMAKGFYWSILLMLAVPFVVVATIAGVLWRAGRKKGGLRDAPRG